MTQKADRRTIRTRNWIKEALLRLMQEKNFEDLYVQDIMREADMNRATFYKHFSDKHQLLHEMIDGLFEQLITEYDPSREQVDFVLEKNPHPKLVHFFTFMNNHYFIFSTLLSKQKDEYFQQKLKEFISKTSFTLLNLARSYQHEVKFSGAITQAFITSSVIGTITWWLEEEMPCEPYEISQYITEMIDHGIYVH